MTREARRALARDRSLRSVVAGFGLFATAEAAAWLAILIHAYDQGGAVEVGLAAGLLLAPAAVLAPLAAPLADRFRRDAVLAAGYGAQAIGLGLLALAIGADSGRLAVYAAGTLFVVAGTFTRPAIGAMLPAVAREPEELSTANAAIGALENVGGLLGPLVAAGLLLASGPATVAAAMAVPLACASLLGLATGRDARLARPAGGSTSVRESIEGGLGFLRRDLDVLLLISCVAAPSLMLGAVEVLLVVVATEQLGQATHVAGYLGSAFGLGGVLGAGAAAWMTGRRGLAVALCAGGLLAGAPIATLSFVAVLPAALACLLASGAGQSFASVVGTTLIQRSAPDRYRASVFGVLEGLETASLALGGFFVSIVSGWLEPSTTLVVVGCSVPIILLLSLSKLHAIDSDARAPGRRTLLALRRDPIFASLGPPVIEHVATRSRIVEVPSRHVVTQEGEIGDRYYCVLRGDLEVRVGGRLVRKLGRGDSFGEIALLHAVPRTATVSTLTPSLLVEVDGADFLETVTRHPQSLVDANAGARRYLGGAAAIRPEPPS